MYNRFKNPPVDVTCEVFSLIEKRWNQLEHKTILTNDRKYIKTKVSVRMFIIRNSKRSLWLIPSGGQIDNANR
jgi:hypothetical protein